MIYAKLCKSMQHCSKLCKFAINLWKMSETYLLGHSLAQFYTVKYTYARLSTKIISTRVIEVFVFNWNNIIITIAWICLKKFFVFFRIYICYIY